MARLDRRAGAVEAMASVRLGRESAAVDGMARRVAPARLAARLTRLDDELTTTGTRVGRAAAQVLGRADQAVDAAAALTGAADPGRALARGFSVTRAADGRLVRDPASVEPGDTLVTTLAGGTLESTATESTSP